MSLLTRYLIFFFILPLMILSCTKESKTPEIVISYKETNITREDYIKRFLKQGFITFGPDLVSKLQNDDQLKRVQDKTVETIVESIFINEMAQEEQIVIKDDELNNWIINRTSGIEETDLNYFLKYSNMTMKEWRSLFKDQLLKIKVLENYKNSSSNSNNTTPTKASPSGNKVKKLEVQTLSFDSTLEAQNIYKELKTFPERFDALLENKKGTTLSDWIGEEEDILYSQAKNLRVGQISKPFDSPWGHLIVKLLDVDQRPKDMKTTDTISADTWSSEYSKKLKKFKESSDLYIDSKSLYSLKIKK